MNELVKLEEYQQALMDAESVEEVGVIRAKMETIAKTIAPRLARERFKWSKGYVKSCVKHGEMWNACENKMPEGGSPTSHSKKIYSENFISVNDAMFKNHMDAMICSRVSLLNLQDIKLYFDDCRGNGKFPSLGGLYVIWKMLNPPDPPPPLPPGTFNVICADPPWSYDNQPEQWGATILHYKAMTTEEICDLKIKEKADDDAVLFLWVTNPMIPDAFDVLDAWGFEYKTNIVWVKTHLKRPGSGFYIRGRHELLFIATRGAFTPLNIKISPPIGSVIRSPVREHSRKPPEAYKIIERLYPRTKRLELFAREKRRGWEVWGDETWKYQTS